MQTYAKLCKFMLIVLVVWPDILDLTWIHNNGWRRRIMIKIFAYCQPCLLTCILNGCSGFERICITFEVHCFGYLSTSYSRIYLYLFRIIYLLFKLIVLLLYAYVLRLGPLSLSKRTISRRNSAHPLCLLLSLRFDEPAATRPTGRYHGNPGGGCYGSIRP